MTDAQFKAEWIEAQLKERVRRLEEAQISVAEPLNDGPRMSQFFEGIHGMGARARANGTIALSVRTRKRAGSQAMIENLLTHKDR